MDFITERGIPSGLSLEGARDLHARGLTEVAALDVILEGVNQRSGPEIDGHLQVGEEAHTKYQRCVQSAILNRIDGQHFQLEDGAREMRGRSLLEMGEEYLGRLVPTCVAWALEAIGPAPSSANVPQLA